MPTRLALEAMATRFELVLDGGSPTHLIAAGEEALDRIREAEQRLSLFRRDSLVSRVNEQAGRQAVHVDDEFLELMELCQAVHRESKGAFDPSIGAVMNELGFRESEPDPKAGTVGFEQVEIHYAERTVKLPTGMSLDLGAVGKGWAIQQAVDILRERRVTSALLHGGTSTVAAIGVPPYEEGWPVAIADPLDETKVLLNLMMRDMALSISAPHGRQVQDAEGQTIGHVVDPRKGRPSVGHALAAAMTKDATIADAWSTALLVLGKPPVNAPLSWHYVLPESTPTKLLDHESTGSS